MPTKLPDDWEPSSRGGRTDSYGLMEQPLGEWWFYEEIEYAHVGAMSFRTYVHKVAGLRRHRSMLPGDTKPAHDIRANTRTERRNGKVGIAVRFYVREP